MGFDFGNFVSGIVNGVEGAVSGAVGDLESLDPLSGLANGLGSLLNGLGIPKEVTDGLKIAAGACTGDVALCADGITGEVGDISHDVSAAATTETGSASAPQGYDTTNPNGVGPLPSDWMKFLGNVVDPSGAGAGGAGGTGGCGGGGDPFADILNDPSMSLEDKVMAILEKCYDQTDQAVYGLADKVGQAQQASTAAQSGGKTSGSTGSSGPNGESLQNLEFKLQDTMQKRSQLMDLMSNLEKCFNDADMNVINNIK
jgi:hypothetical protein